jgi:hypothetical protein
MDEKKGLNNIQHIYENLNYFDQYGASVISVIIITMIVIVLVAYCYAKTNIQPIVNDWANQRCKPYFIPIAGFISKPENMTATDYTLQNFNYCSQNILTSITGTMLQPLTFITNMLNTTLTDATQDMNNIRAMFDKVRTFFQTITQEIMGRLMNIMIPLQQIIISFKDMIGKIQGTMTAGLFTLLGSYYTLQSMMGAIAEFLIIILIAMAVMIVIFWLIPFTWGAAISMTALFVAISIPLALMLAFMMDVLQVQPDLSIPTLKCFDKNTSILMKNGKSKKISNICVGEPLESDGVVTAKIKVKTKGSIMYRLGDIIVSDTHLVHYKGTWLRVIEHPEAIKIDEYNEPYLYCLNTSSKTIFIDKYLFSDWDELVGNDFTKIINESIKDKKLVSREIHELFDSGFRGNTKIKMNNMETREIQSIKVGDILEKGEKVIGVVEINGSDMNQYQYILGKHNFIKGSSNIILYDKNDSLLSTMDLEEGKFKKQTTKKEDKLYHLLTDTKSFHIYNIRFGDYNATIDSILGNM